MNAGARIVFYGEKGGEEEDGEKKGSYGGEIEEDKKRDALLFSLIKTTFMASIRAAS